jgi:adenylate cyclase
MMFANRIGSSTNCSIWLPETSPTSSSRDLIRQHFQACNTSVESTLNQHPDAAEVLGIGAATLVYLGQNTRAVEWARRAVVLEPSNFTVHCNAASTYAVIGEGNIALQHLEYILFQVPRARPWLWKIIKNDPQFDSLRGHADFENFIKRLEADADAKC